MSKRKIKHVAGNQTLRYVLRGKRPLSCEIVPVLYGSHAARSSTFQP